MRLIINSILALSFIVACKSEPTIKQEDSNIEAERLVSLSGAITETIYALGEGEKIVGRDVTSTYPEGIDAIDLGHVNQLTIEPILSTSPTIILYSQKDINTELFQQIDKSQIRLENVEHDYSIHGAKSLIENIAKIIEVEDYQHLIDKIDSDFAKVEAFEEKPKVLFIYARENLLLVAGKNTAMQAMIELAGGEGAITEFEDFKPLTPEALLQINPDVIMFFDKGFQAFGGMEALLEFPGVKQTNAGINQRVVTMDGGLMTNFGPRTGEAALELNQKLIEVMNK